MSVDSEASGGTFRSQGMALPPSLQPSPSELQHARSVKGFLAFPGNPHPELAGHGPAARLHGPPERIISFLLFKQGTADCCFSKVLPGEPQFFPECVFFMSPLESYPQSVWNKTPEHSSWEKNMDLVMGTSSSMALAFTLYTWDSSVALLETVVKVSF